MDDISILPWHQQPCHADAGLRDGGHLWLRFFLSFLLDKKGPKNQGRHQGPTALGNRPSPMSAGPARPARSRFGVPALGVRCCRFLSLRHAPAPSRHRGPSPFQRGCPKGGGLRSRDLLRSWDSLLSSLRVIARHEAIHL